WSALGAGAAGGTGVSGSATPVTDLAVATDGTKVAVSWSQAAGGAREIYLREYNGSWSELGGSATGGGVSSTAGLSVAPSLAYLGGTLFAAWQDHTSGMAEVYAARYSGSAWVDAGAGSRAGGGVSRTGGEATQPELAAGGGRLYLAWLDNRVRNF